MNYDDKADLEMANKTMKIEEILKSEYGLELKRFKKIKFGVVNDNFYIFADDKEYLLKIYKIDNEEKVKFEISLHEFLKKNNFPAPRIVKNLNEDFYGKNDNDNVYVLFEYIQGEMLKNINVSKVDQIGRLSGMLHYILKDFQQHIEVKNWDKERVKKIIFEEGNIVLQRKLKKKYEFVNFIREEFDKLDLDYDFPKGMTHQDIKPENIIEDQEGNINFIDFNNCYRGVLLYDVMTFVSWALFEDGTLNFEFFKEYLKAYESQRAFNEIEKDKILEALKFRLLREAYVWPFKWRDKNKATKNAWMFLNFYKNIINNEEYYKNQLNKIWQN